MKKYFFILFMGLTALLPFSLTARDFKYTYKGQMITYTVIDESAKTCKTKDGDTNEKTGNMTISGELILPEKACDDQDYYSVIEIGQRSFYGCSITSVEIPNSVTKIGDMAFIWCDDMTSVIIPNSITEIGRSAFFGCTGLTSLTIPSSVTEIGNSAFRQCSGLTSVTILNSKIGELAFYNCGSLTSVTISNSVTEISNSAFFNCGLTSVTIPNSVKKIGDSAFYGCSSLTSVTIPMSVSEIGEMAFSQCPSLEITVDKNNKYYCSSEGVLYNKNKTAILQCPSSKTGNFIIPNSITEIGPHAFYYCTGLTSVTIPTSVKKIGEYAFYKCTGLTSVTIPNSVTEIREYAFYKCSGITSATIPNSVTEIGEYAFAYCGLTSVTIPKSVKKIGAGAFSSYPTQPEIIVDKNNKYYCSLEGVLYNKNKTLILQCPGSKTGNFIIPNTVTEVGASAFYNCTGLTSVTIPNSVTKIGASAFCYCTGRMTVPKSVTEIGESAFYYCIGLTSIEIPESVKEIGDYAFYYCKSLTSMTCYSTEPYVDNDIFNLKVAGAFCTFDNATLYIPKGTLEKYQTTEPWKYFKNIKEIDFAGIEDVAVSNNPDSCEVYNLNGMKVGDNTENLAPGIYIVKSGGKTRKVII